MVITVSIVRFGREMQRVNDASRLLPSTKVAAFANYKSTVFKNVESV